MANLMDSQGDLEQLSGVETFKARSRGLRGTIAEELAQATSHFSEENVQLLKHHGSYQQDDRDIRRERKKEGLEPAYTMMLRTKFPGGRITGAQYLICDELSTKYGQNDMRATSRQDLQFHGVLKGSFYPLIHTLNTLAKISSLGGCGDVVRNTMASPVADIDRSYAKCGHDLIALGQAISDYFMPRTTAYYDLWINGEKAQVHDDGTITYAGEEVQEVEDPIYGKQYLPRKFKIGVGADFDNSVDVYTQDVGVMAVTDDGVIVGYEILAGGGLGFSHTKKETYARAGTPLAFVSYDEVIPICEAIVKVQRDYGERTDRKQARLKYTIDRMGQEAFRDKVFEYAGRSFGAPRGVKPYGQPDYLGWHKQIQPGLNYVGCWIENGRIRDFDSSYQFKTGLRVIIDKFRPSVRITPHHNVILADIKDADVDAVQALLEEYNIPTDKGISTLRRMEMACPALPLCGLAQSESERVFPDVIKGLEEAGHGDAPVVIRMTGCPNGCARSSSSEIGLIGKGPDRYILQIGGDYNGSRFNDVLLPTIKLADIVPTLAQLLDLWKSQRQANESFGDWSHRLGMESLRSALGVEAASK
ncbi:MAG: NADPH-dependent assimilatory sulfite reductase hemoprotein subunit [Candidatus Hydrogenedentes bacterium]|nr:NADPH-dependent assimilatory sulfite reductase hemoprotein subunit [Candidatus Hydrogenedentota bacterium]